MLRTRVRYSRDAFIVRARQLLCIHRKQVALWADLVGLCLVAGLFSLPCWLGILLGWWDF